MISTYFKQALRSIRQNRLFSAIYITGTALAIASTTVFAGRIEPIDALHDE